MPPMKEINGRQAQIKQLQHEVDALHRRVQLAVADAADLADLWTRLPGADGLIRTRP